MYIVYVYVIHIVCVFYLQYITNEGTLFTFKTNLKAPRYRLIKIDFSKPEMVSALKIEVENGWLQKTLKPTLFVCSGFVQIRELSFKFQKKKKNVHKNVISPVGKWRKLQCFQR